MEKTKHLGSEEIGTGRRPKQKEPATVPTRRATDRLFAGFYFTKSQWKEWDFDKLHAKLDSAFADGNSNLDGPPLPVCRYSL